jgi:MazG family protein
MLKNCKNARPGTGRFSRSAIAAPPLPGDNPRVNSFDDLVAVLRRLRKDCPWDKAQTAASLKPYILEEAYELCDAIDQETPGKLREELGDFAMQFILQAILAEERSEFTLDEALRDSAAKLIARHPHVYGEAVAKDADAVVTGWEARKNAQRAAAGDAFFASVPRAFPALARAAKLSQKAATVGFDWPDDGGVIDKIHEEVAELRAAAPQNQAEELGDLLFALVNLARRMKLDPEAALQAANDKFIRRFHQVEAGLRADGRRLGEATLDEMEALWQRAKAAERESAVGKEG